MPEGDEDEEQSDSEEEPTSPASPETDDDEEEDDEGEEAAVKGKKRGWFGKSKGKGADKKAAKTQTLDCIFQVW